MTRQALVSSEIDDWFMPDRAPLIGAIKLTFPKISQVKTEVVVCFDTGVFWPTIQRVFA
jgi:hypothetical protein